MSLAERLWAVVLAGGEGWRLRSLTRRICGDERPKQFVPILGGRSLLRQTLDRTGRLVPANRTVLVTAESHGAYVAAELAAAAPDQGPAPHVLAQPADRGTAAGILLPAHWISWRDPSATVAVFPSDHFIRDEVLFMACLAEVALFVERQPEWTVLLGARPKGPEIDYGWIEPGEPVTAASGPTLFRIRGFVEKPSKEAARSAMRGGAFWNTFVIVAKAARLVEVGRQLLPDLSDRLSRLERFVGTEHERWALHHAYALLPKADFSRAVLERHPSHLAVAPLPPVMWSDWGRPRRVKKTLEELGITPAWLPGRETPS